MAEHAGVELAGPAAVLAVGHIAHVPSHHTAEHAGVELAGPVAVLAGVLAVLAGLLAC